MSRRIRKVGNRQQDWESDEEDKQIRAKRRREIEEAEASGAGK